MTTNETLQAGNYSITVRLKIRNRPGMLAKVTSAIGEAGGNIGAVDTPEITAETVTRDISLAVADKRHEKLVVEAIKAIREIKVVNVSSSVLLAHLGGKIEVSSKKPLKTRADLSTYYTPGVAEVCLAIAEDAQKAYSLTMRGNTVAIVTDGTAVLGLGDIGPAAALPVMEGKAMLFKEFGAVDAFPVCLNTKDTDKIVETVKYLAPAFGGINLEDISAPRCFDIEDRLCKELDIPVFHDDQHGTAVVVAAGLMNALRIVDKDISNVKIVFSGAGAGGIATAKLLILAGARNIIGCDRMGTVWRGRKEHMNSSKEEFARITNPDNVQGTLADAVEGADVFIGLSGPGLLPAAAVRKMALDPVVFALANPTPEIMPEEAAPYARIVATGRSDYPNQINNVLCFPGLFRGVLDCGATRISDEMLLAAANAIAACVSPRQLHEDYIIPSVFNMHVGKAVARSVTAAALKAGLTSRSRGQDVATLP